MRCQCGTFTAMATPGKRSSTKAAEQSDIEQLSRLHIWHVQAVRDVLVVAAIIAVFWMGYALRAVTVPLLVALLLAYLFEPFIQWLSRRPKLNRVRAVSMLLAAGILTVLLILAIVVPLAISQTTRFIDDIQDGSFRANLAKVGQYMPSVYHQQFEDVLDLLPGNAQAAPSQISSDDENPPTDGEDAAATAGDNAVDTSAQDESLPDTPQTQTETLTGIDQQRLEQLIDERIATFEALQEANAAVESNEPTDWFDLARKGARTVISVLGFVVSLGLLAFLIPFYFFFFSLWYPEVLTFGEKFIPNKNKQRVLELLKKMDNVVAGFVRGRIVISLIMGVMLAIGWMICDVPYAIPLGIIVGIFCAVPYLGVVGIPAAIALLFFDQLGLEQSERMVWWGVLLWPSLVFGIVQVIEGYVLTPTIAGKATNLDPVTILVAVLAGGSVLGIYGMLLAIPFAACAKIMVVDVLMPKVKEWTEGRRQDPLPIERD